MSTKRRSEIEEALRICDPRYTLHIPPFAKSNVWNNFKLIKCKGKPEEYARCNCCGDVLKYRTKCGTGGLLRHRCYRLSQRKKDAKSTISNMPVIHKSSAASVHITTNPQNSINNGNSSAQSNIKISTPNIIIKQEVVEVPTISRAASNITQSIVPKNRKSFGKAKELIAYKQLGLIAKDLIPIDVMEGEGFIELAQSLVKIGAQYGNMDVKELFAPQETLLRDTMPQEFNRLRYKLTDILMQNQLAFSVDVWSDKKTLQSFLTLSTHFVDNNFILKNYILGTQEIQTQVDDTKLLEVVWDILSAYNIQEKFNQSNIVTRADLHIPAVNFEPSRRLPCACHTLNAIMEDVLNEGCSEELENMFEACKTLMHFFVQSELNNQLTVPLEKPNSIRWHALYIMLSSISAMYSEIEQLLLQNYEMSRLSKINLELLNSVLEFLCPFKECSESLGAETVPTIQLYTLWFEKLKKHCERSNCDQLDVQQLKIMAKLYLENKFVPSALHNIALFLNPPYKRLNALPEKQHKAVLNQIRIMLTDVKERQQLNKQTEPSTPSPRSLRWEAIFEEYKDNSQDIGVRNELEDIDAEMHAYLQKNIRNCNVLEFWRNAVDLPLLRSLAKQVLNIPASATATERTFSKSMCALGEKRSQFVHKNIDMVLFLHKNL